MLYSYVMHETYEVVPCRQDCFGQCRPLHKETDLSGRHSKQEMRLNLVSDNCKPVSCLLSKQLSR